MQAGAITQYFDVAQVALYVFWGFFAALVIYLQRESAREGVPESSSAAPARKSFIMQDGSAIQAPRGEVGEPVNGVLIGNYPGAPYEPVGNPLLAGMGPGAYANRPDTPELMFEDGTPKIVPLRAAGEFFLAWEDPDPRGMTVVGDDGVVAGTVSEAWVDKSEVVVRYLEVALTGGGHVLLPINDADIRPRLNQVRVQLILGHQFADVPPLKNPDSVTQLEEEKITAYYAAGLLYATPQRSAPLI